MDLLSSLGLGNALPEQSTRLSSHPGIVKALDNHGADVRIGFNHCLHCGASLPVASSKSSSSSASNPESAAVIRPVSCKGCKRVKYCSSSCRTADSEEDPSQYGDDQSACGHSPVICALLNLCNDDDDAEEELLLQVEKTATKNSKNKSKPGGKSKDPKEEAARYRVQTELESYPATLFNILSESPDWFVEALTQRLRSSIYGGGVISSKDSDEDAEEERSSNREQQKRRGKRDRVAATPSPPNSSSSNTNKRKRRNELVLHIVGASVDSELWNWNGTTNKEDGRAEAVFSAYAEASTNLTSHLKNLLESSIDVRCIFIGPDCPKTKSASPCTVEVPIPETKSSKLIFETHCCNYGEDDEDTKKQKQKKEKTTKQQQQEQQTQQHQQQQPSTSSSSLSAPDAIIFFNPGFSCPDYDWSMALTTAASYSSSYSSSLDEAANNTPFLITTNTEMEGIADVKCLLDGGYVHPRTIPDHILEAVDYSVDKEEEEDEYDDDDEPCFFFSENPYAGLRVRQSGTMGNDLYVKNRWIVGGLFSGSGMMLGGGGGGDNAGVCIGDKTSSSSKQTNFESNKKQRKVENVVDEKKTKTKTKKNTNNKKKRHDQIVSKEDDDSEGENGDTVRSKKRQKSEKRQNDGSSKNTKRKNPALI